jgi:hypothetical protein
MPDLSYSRVKIHEATEILAISTGPVKERVMLAASRRLVFADVSALPPDLQAVLSSIWKRLLKKDPTYPGESRLQATLFRMHQSTAAKIAKDIWRLNLALTERAFRPDWPAPRPTRLSTRTRKTSARRLALR